MVHKTHKKHHTRRNKTSKLGIIKSKKDKRCYTDNEIGKICSTGQYSTYEGNFYKNKKNLEKFAAISAKFKKNPKYKQFKTQSERYTKFLNDNFYTDFFTTMLRMAKIYVHWRNCFCLFFSISLKGILK